MIVGIPKETYPGEKRVAMAPASLPALAKAGLEVLVQAGAGVDAGFPDAEFEKRGAKIAPTRADVFAQADIICQVRTVGANPVAGRDDLKLIRKGQLVIGASDPLTALEQVKALAATGAASFALELIPRITRAQSMDILSSMATISGYKAVLMAADHLPRMFPMMMTAAGTITPAHVFVIGAGVAGLQAIASAKRLGAVVEAYDVRAAVKEQIESLGGKFVQFNLESAEGAGGYAKEQSADFIRRQQEQMAEVVARNDVVITTAAIPGKKSPVLVTAAMVARMAPGSVIVDLAAERGGNCELTRLDEVVTTDNGVTILGPGNLPATIPYHASQMFAKNVATFLANMVKGGQLNLNLDDEIIRETLMTRDGEVYNARQRELLGLPALPRHRTAAELAAQQNADETKIPLEGAAPRSSTEGSKQP
ncbi:MAG: NAD(P) transhydrogenase subunit alpha part 1 [Phycisphaerae bacterium]|nr:NAD(P) transhydrogenase subunit alpha part 1 [Phycisphaerae bacterium]